MGRVEVLLFVEGRVCFCRRREDGRGKRWKRCTRWRSVPTDSHRESPFLPVPSRYYGHLALCIGAGPVEDLVRVAVFSGVEFVRMGVRVGREAVMAVRSFYCCHRVV